jgi:hypothetical protein
MAGFGAAPAPGGKAMVSVFDGTRNLYQDAGEILITVRDGNQETVSREYHETPSVEFPGLQVFGNAGDNYTILAWADGYKDAGVFPVKIAANTVRIVDLMLIPKSNQLNFAQAGWGAIRANRPAVGELLAAGTGSEDAASGRYSDLMETQGGAVLACLLNITTAIGQIQLPQKTPLDYLKTIEWRLDGPNAMAQDRFFGWADAALISQLDLAKQQNEFADAPVTLHPGATRSYKQIQFGEANVQLTFHEKDRQTIDGIDCVLVEPDIDYYRDPAAHLLLEVAVNAFGSLTDPRTVYVLRWIAGRHAGIPEFDPLYTIVKA